ncbi:MAG: DUF4105 domain-containing protein [Elusimicrobiota bacterium]|nr:DUF4105 domain-containing protein [Elusimicrobiota bacterium]
MKKRIIAIIFILALTANTAKVSANNNPIFSTDINISEIQNQDLAIPLPQMEETKGDTVGFYYDVFFGWDPDSPFTKHQRPSIIASNNNSLIEIQNTRWGYTPKGESNWETAYINPALLDKVYYGAKDCETGHTLFVFVFKPGGFVNSKGEDGVALTIGAEGWYREFPGYSPTDGMRDRYPLIFKATTLKDYADYTVFKEGNNLFLHTMNLSKKQESQVLEKVVERIIKNNKSKEFYHTLNNSCTIIPVQIYNSILPKEQQIKTTTFLGTTSLNVAIPKLALKKYIKNGLVNPDYIHITKENINQFNSASLR